jgi:MFS family permease
MSAAPGVRTQDRPCADGLEQSALRLHRRAVPREAAFWLVGYVFGAVILGTALPVPLYAIYQRQWHFSSGVLTLIFAVYAVAVLATLLLAGQASDQVGRKPVLAAALCFSAASTVVFIFAASPAWLYPARILSGVSAGLMTGAATAALSEMVQASASRRASMVATTANSGAGALGPLMAGLFAQYLPQPTVLVFEVFLVFLGAAALALAFIPETVTGRERLSLRFTGLAIPAEGRSEFIAAGVAVFAAYALNGLFASLVPGFTTVMLHHPDYAVAGGVTCVFFAAGAVAALGLAPFNSRPVLLGGLGLFLVGLALVVAAMSAASLALFLVGAVVAGSAFGALVIGSLSAANRLAAPGTRAKAISTYFVFAYAGLSIPVVGVGVASDYVGSFRAVLGCSIVLAGLCVFSAALGARAAGRLSTELGDTERVPARLSSKNARHPDAARPPALSSRIEGVPMTTAAQIQQQPIRSTIPARLDRLRWSPFHTRLVLGLGTAWVLDGLSITIASSVTSKLTQPDTLHLTTTEAASIGTVYLIGEVIGALVFGKLSDNLGRRKLFVWTLAVYLAGSGLTALTPKGSSWIVYLYATRVIAGMGIGGEYSAINSAIDEMMPARYRGRTDVWINGSYWLGAIIGTFATFLILSSLRTSIGWRIAFLAGPALAFVIILVRRNLPESPRWLITHGRVREAEQAVHRIEEEAIQAGQHLEPVPESEAILIRPEKRYGYLTLLRVAFRVYPRRAILGATLMITQSFLYNAIFFTYALVLTRFYHVSNNNVPLYGLAFAVGNLAGPLLLGHLFDTLGRKKMISGTYLISGALLSFSAWLFASGALSAAGQVFIWIVVFFFASAGASAGYLTVSEIFPIEIRAEAIAVFFAVAQVVGAVGPAFYGTLIGNGSSRTGLAIGYLVGGSIMMIGGLVEIVSGVNAEGKPLEEIAAPLSEVDS